MSEDRSNERADVARRVLELSETIGEAIGYMLDKLEYAQIDMDACAVMLKDIGEGLISLENAASAVSEPIGADPEVVGRLPMEYDELCERLDAMVDAYLEERAGDFPALGKLLRESFSAYEGSLSACFRKSAVM
ncbi:MAG: hypothetical protein FWH01_02085 [Oscillospiraceae bacterium]|nr:hypothetical protein [Oscillospiraceae bacterium]